MILCAVNLVTSLTLKHLFLIHENAVIGKINLDDIRRVFVIPNTNPMLLDGYEKYEELLYEGAKNSMEISQRFRIEYDCVFDLTKFPFDKQKCNFIFEYTLFYLSRPQFNYKITRAPGALQITTLVSNKNLSHTGKASSASTRKKAPHNEL